MCLLFFFFEFVVGFSGGFLLLLLLLLFFFFSALRKTPGLRTSCQTSCVVCVFFFFYPFVCVYVEVYRIAALCGVIPLQGERGRQRFAPA